MEIIGSGLQPSHDLRTQKKK